MRMFIAFILQSRIELFCVENLIQTIKKDGQEFLSVLFDL